MSDDPDFLDSFAPYDAEVCTNEAWKLPEGESLAGKFDQPPRFGWGDFWVSFWTGLTGGPSV